VLGIKDRTLLDMNAEEAKSFFMRNRSYAEIELPPYFDFEDMLKHIDEYLQGHNFKDIIHPSTKPEDCVNVNYTIVVNKNNRYTWRPLELINPVLYMGIVNLITKDTNWEIIQKLFRNDLFIGNEKIECVSIPTVPCKHEIVEDDEKYSEQDLEHDKFEQRSLELAIDYSYVFSTDISDCYGSIYTHAISWAIEGKENAKKKKGRPDKDKSLGGQIDYLLRAMHYGQTNGIPQGSVLMDFIAEIILHYVDCELNKKLVQNCNSSLFGNAWEYHIVRFCDDYRIFVNDPVVGEKILKYLSDVLIDLGLKLNTAKTFMSQDVIEATVNTDKMYWIQNEHSFNYSCTDNQNMFLRLYDFSKKFPNSKALKRILNRFNKKFIVNKEKDNLNVLLNIISEIACNSHITCPVAMAIISKILNSFDSKQDIKIFVDTLIKRFSGCANTGFEEIWLQRITNPFNLNFSFPEKLCKTIEPPCYDAAFVWEFDWIGYNDLLQLLYKEHIVNIDTLLNMTPEIANDELWEDYYPF